MRGLGLEARELVDGIVQLAVRVGQLVPVDHELEALDERRIVPVGAGERRHLARVVEHEGRLDELVLDERVVDLVGEPARAPLGLEREVEAAQHGARLVELHRGVEVDADVLLDEIDHRRPSERSREFDRLRSRRDPHLRHDRAGAGDDEPLDEVHHVVVVAVGLVRLEHRELGVVGGVDALVAEHSPDLEDAVEAADDESLQVQLQRDPQVHVLTEGIVVRHERSGGRAAVDRLEHRALDLAKVAIGQMPAQGRDDLDAGQRDAACVLVDHEVHVTLPVARVDVGEAVPLVGQRTDGLGEELEGLDGHAELAATGGHHRAFDADPVAAVEAVELPVLRLAELVRAHEELDGAVAVLERREAQLALSTQQQEPTRDPHPHVGALPGREVAVLSADAPGRRRRVEAHGVGIDTGGAQGVDLRQPLLTLVAQLLGGRLVGLVVGPEAGVRAASLPGPGDLGRGLGAGRRAGALGVGSVGHRSEATGAPRRRLGPLGGSFMARLDGKVALITGAGNGMGRVASTLFAGEGARVVVADWSEDGGRETVAAIEAGGGQAAFVKVDVSDAEQVEAMVAFTLERFGALHVLYNNAGIFPADDGGVTETPEPTWDRVMDINLKGVWLGCKYGVPAMLSSGGGSIVNVASFVALMGAATAQIAYTASKGGVLAMTREIAVEYGRAGIRANSLCPGPISTPMLEELMSDPARKARRLVHIPMGRLGNADELAARRCSSRRTSPRS